MLISIAMKKNAFYFKAEQRGRLGFEAELRKFQIGVPNSLCRICPPWKA